ncbi:hypothetical protein PTSG_08236 [Salpingoeca rosetta]|uniref:Uncharacterized protein n=1 Tax=Salpingoeca rosetta (strain ATCC 50818 / BSB-021) TaxID=946362 RepID=F2UIE1_SALR5|nr:uncharacterized protein PTSG_08236 [Salpingoeca rosetta]EGD76890.1 hypothetical protein PTSG_08236 [Salpingoeca rosetta]|eukprot:XP_004991262.1 hypothetical protein PTSG_08236 [Salpingoeca rosetta]
MTADRLLSNNGVLKVTTRWLRFFATVFTWPSTSQDCRPDTQEEVAVHPLYRRELSAVYELCHLVPVVHIDGKGDEDEPPTTMDISLFQSVRVLRLCHVELRLVHGLHAVKDQLQQLVLYRCVDPIDAVLVSFGADRLPFATVTPASVLATPAKQAGTADAAGAETPNTALRDSSAVQGSVARSRDTAITPPDGLADGGDGGGFGADEVWPALHILDAACNELHEISRSIARAPNVHTLVLSSNKIAALAIELARLQSLHTLSLGYNHITSVAVVRDIAAQHGLQKLTHLTLCFNQIKSLDGLQFLSNLTVLNVAHNRISDLREIDAFLVPLPFLRELDLRGNTVVMQSDVHPLIFALFGRDRWRSFVLNDITARDLTNVQLVHYFLKEFENPHVRASVLAPRHGALDTGAKNTAAHLQALDPTRVQDVDVLRVAQSERTPVQEDLQGVEGQASPHTAKLKAKKTKTKSKKKKKKKKKKAAAATAVVVGDEAVEANNNNDANIIGGGGGDVDGRERERAGQSQPGNGNNQR